LRCHPFKSKEVLFKFDDPPSDWVVLLPIGLFKQITYKRNYDDHFLGKIIHIFFVPRRLQYHTMPRTNPEHPATSHKNGPEHAKPLRLPDTWTPGPVIGSICSSTSVLGRKVHLSYSTLSSLLGGLAVASAFEN
jgi:hypothetical protein